MEFSSISEEYDIGAFQREGGRLRFETLEY